MLLAAGELHLHTSPAAPPDPALTHAVMLPCMRRYLSTGSEAAAVYMYDLRQGVGLARINEGLRHDTWVADVAYHPLRPQLAAGCMDGSVQLFGE